MSEPCATAAEIEAALNDVEKQIMLETKVGKVVDVLSILLKSKSKFFLNWNRYFDHLTIIIRAFFHSKASRTQTGKLGLQV